VNIKSCNQGSIQLILWISSYLSLDKYFAECQGFHEDIENYVSQK